MDAWLRCIARHLIIDHFRAANRCGSVELRDALAQLVALRRDLLEGLMT